ncbi:maleylpyruvate isomerase family mycothiol-dependent enzyme (plasmid) [Rhizobium bangladeshense]|nr:maleylpyruvate isomerase family mycothiol-dependent enzyme [Rhizobium bangladeshense]
MEVTSLTSTVAESEAQAALRERQGKGARYDSPSAPASDLALARLGTAYFARSLNAIRDEDLSQDSLIPGWSRRHVIAFVAYQARQLALAIEAVHDGAPLPEIDQAGMLALVDDGATLPARALRNLVDHAEVHLNVGWRDLSASAWQEAIKWDGALLPLRMTPWIRARSVWVHAVDLDNKGSYLDFPPVLLEAMAVELVGDNEFGHSSLTRNAGDLWTVNSLDAESSVSGAPADIVRWLSGRGARRLSKSVESVSSFDLTRWPPIPTRPA